MNKRKSEVQKWSEKKDTSMVEMRVKECRIIDLTTEDANIFVEECGRLHLAGIGAFQFTAEGIKIIKLSDELQQLIIDYVCHPTEEKED